MEKYLGYLYMIFLPLLSFHADFVLVCGAFCQLHSFSNNVAIRMQQQQNKKTHALRWLQEISDPYCSSGSYHRLSSTKNKESDFETFVDQNQLREALRNCKTFQGLSTIDIEAIVQSCTDLTLEASAVLFQEGDVGDGMYYVKSGSIEIISETRNQVLTTVETGGLFGELSLLFNEPRAASARASGTGPVRLWKLSKADYISIIEKNRNIQQRAIQVVSEDPNYNAYIELRQLKGAMTDCPIFKGFDKADLERSVQNMEQVSFNDGEVIIQQGDDGDAMYFIKSGSVICVDEKSSEVVNKIEEGGYFGELALLFSKKRAVTVRASGSVELWKLSTENFNEAVQNYKLADKAMELLKDRYQTKTLWSTLRKSSFRDIIDLIYTASRPKKKNVSFHSIISTLYSSMFFLVLLPHINPKRRNRFGTPQLFNFWDVSPTTILQMRATLWLSILIAIMGMFRIPKNAPYCRKMLFLITAVIMVNFAVTGDSNMFGSVSNFTFDLSSKIGSAVIMLSNLSLAPAFLSVVDDSIAGSNKGRETLPFFNKRWTGVLYATMLYFLFYFQIRPVLFPLLDSQGYQKYAVPFYRCGYEISAGLATSFMFTGYMSFGALFATLVFERKMSVSMAGILNLLFILPITLEFVFSFAFTDPNLPAGKLFASMNAWITSVTRSTHFNEIFVGIYLFVFANAFRKVLQNKLNERKKALPIDRMK